MRSFLNTAILKADQTARDKSSEDKCKKKQIIDPSQF